MWFDSRFYRMNILWENGTLRIRDIHLFDENMPSVYETTPATANECTFFTLPVVDGYIWSKPDRLAGLRLKASVNGKEILLEGGDPLFTRKGDDIMHVSWPLRTVKGSLEIDLSEKKMAMELRGGPSIDWWLELTTADGVKLPYDSVSAQRVDCSFEGMKYSIRLEKGSFSKSAGAGLRMSPQGNIISLGLSDHPDAE
jgi:hypothetical protein